MKKLLNKIKNFFRARKNKKTLESIPDGKTVFIGDGAMRLIKYDGRYYIFDSSLGGYSSKWIV